jgi:hypothetical protein
MLAPKSTIPFLTPPPPLLLLTEPMTIKKFSILCTGIVKFFKEAPKMRKFHISIALRICGSSNLQLSIRAEELKFLGTCVTLLPSFTRKIKKKLFGLFKNTSRSHSFTKHENSI